MRSSEGRVLQRTTLRDEQLHAVVYTAYGGRAVVMTGIDEAGVLEAAWENVLQLVIGV